MARGFASFGRLGELARFPHPAMEWSRVGPPIAEFQCATAVGAVSLPFLPPYAHARARALRPGPWAPASPLASTNIVGKQAGPGSRSPLDQVDLVHSGEFEKAE